MMAALKRRSDFAKPWLTWSVALMYYMLLEMRRFEAAAAVDAEWILEHSAGVRCGRDPYFAKLMEKLVRLQTTLRVRLRLSSLCWPCMRLVLAPTVLLCCPCYAAGCAAPPLP